jgi:hypothetical protein
VFTEVGSAVAGFTLSLMPAPLARSSGRTLAALAVGASFALVVWPIVGGRAAASAAAGSTAGLVARLAIGAVLARAARAR